MFSRRKNLPGRDALPTIDQGMLQHVQGPTNGFESLIYRVLLHLDSMGSSKPKTVEKLQHALKKWMGVILLMDPFQVLKKENFDVRVGRTISMRYTEESIVKNLQKKILHMCAGATICVVDEKCPFLQHVMPEITRKISSSLSQVLEKCPDSNQFQARLNELIQSLHFTLSGCQRKKDQRDHDLLSSLLIMGVKNLQRYNYLSVNESNQLTYNFPSNVLVRSMRKILVQYQKITREEFERGAPLNSSKCCVAIKEHCTRANDLLDQLTGFLDVSDETKAGIQEIFSEALDVLHKKKSSGAVSSSNSPHRNNDLFNRVFCKQERRFSRTPSIDADAQSSSSAYDSDNHVPRVRLRSRSRSPPRSRHVSPNENLQSRRRSNSQSSMEDVLDSPKVRSRSSSADSSSESDIEVTKRPLKRVAERSLSPSSKRKREEDNLREEANNFSVWQAEILAELVGLSLFDRDSSETAALDKENDFEELCTCLKSLSVADIPKLPDDMCLIDLIIIEALDKMGDSKPKTLNGLMNALKPTFKLLFVLNPRRFVIQTKQKESSSKSRKPKRDIKYIPIASVNLTETISLRKGGLFKPQGVPNFLCLDEPSAPRNRERSRNRFNHGETEATLEKLRKTDLDLKADIEQNEVYKTLSKLARHRANSIGSTVVRAKLEEKGFFVKRFVDWKQSVIRRRGEKESMDHGTEMNMQTFDFKHSRSLLEELLPLFVKRTDLSFDTMFALLEKTGLMAKTSSGEVTYTPEFEAGDWKSYWRECEKKLLNELHF